MKRDSDSNGSDAYRVVPGRDDGWDVVIEHDHRVVSATHCSDWHRVERLCAALERQQHAGSDVAERERR